MFSPQRIPQHCASLAAVDGLNPVEGATGGNTAQVAATGMPGTLPYHGLLATGDEYNFASLN